MKSILLLALSIMIAAQAMAAEMLKPGDAVPAFAAKDQHGNAFDFKPGLRFLLISFDMSDGKAANKVLAEKGAAYLPEKKAVFVSNIHGMPGIGRAFALPKMRKYPHQIILADDEKLLEPFPKQKDRVTILALDPAGKITEVRYWNAEKEPLDQALRSSP